MKRVVLLAAAMALPLLGLATSAQATHGGPYLVRATIQYGAHEDGGRRVLCRYPDIVTPTDGLGLYKVTSTGPAVVTTDWQFIGTEHGQEVGGTIDGILVRFDNSNGMKGGKIRVWVSCDRD